MRNKILVLACVVAASSALAACGGSASYADGTYSAQSEVYINEDDDSEDGNGYGVVSITIKDGAITECTYKTYEVDGTLKDENYGKEGGSVANKDYFNKAQKAVAACDQYAKALVEKQNVKDVDAITGATINYNEFQDAVTLALKQASGK